MATVNAESVLNFVQSAYQTIDQLNLSIEMLAVLAVIVTIAFLFALREIGAWFFKIDDLKKDIRSLEDGISRLEVEIKALHSSNHELIGASESAAPKLVIKHSRPEQFPINH